MATKKKAAQKTKKQVTKAKPAGKKKAAVKKKQAAKKTGRAAHRAAAKTAAQVQHSPASFVQASESDYQFWRRSNYKTLAEFWPFYLNEHRHLSNRRLHFIGSSLGLVLLGVAIGLGNAWYVLAALTSGYAFAWVGHFFIEKNRPATFRYPLKSFISDWRMWYCMLTGRTSRELNRYAIHSK